MSTTMAATKKIMASELEKGKVEVSTFKRFAEVADVNCDFVEKQSPEEGKPDLKCIIDGKVVYFELTEACSEDVAKAIAKAMSMDDAAYKKIKDYTSETYRRKINKQYAVSEPVELLIYNVGRTILTDDVLIENIKAISSIIRDSLGKFGILGKVLVSCSIKSFNKTRHFSFITLAFVSGLNYSI